MQIFKYAKVVVLAPAVGSALIGIAGMLICAVLIFGRGQAGHRALNDTGHDPASFKFLLQGSLAHAPAGPTAAASKTQPGAAERPSRPGELSRIKEQRSGDSARKQADVRLNFTSPISGSQLAFLNVYAGRPANDADGKHSVKTLVSMVVPYTPYHFGVDFPLPQVLNTLLLNEPQPIEIRDGRYAMMSGARNAIQRRAGLLWVDMREGFSLGAIYFEPANGEPSPTLTIFSRQLDRRTVRMSQLPRAFVEDLSRWAAREGVPSITTRYFIGASGDKYVLAHDENYCAGAEGMRAAFPKSVCKKMNAQAALIDMTATRFMEQTHNASNATMHMIASTGRVE